MIHRLYQRFKRFSARRWMLIGGGLGISAIPCPGCGTPLIYHVLPIALPFLAVQAFIKHYQKKVTSGIGADKFEVPVLPNDCQGHSLDKIFHTETIATKTMDQLTNHTDRKDQFNG